MSELRLRDGDSVAIIGGGPAGALSAYFLLVAARDAGLRLNVSLFEGKTFGRAGAGACNQSAGVIANDFSDELRLSGIPIPDEVIQRRIEGYLIETQAGSVRLHPPREDEQIITVFRGSGPSGGGAERSASFDEHLLRFAEQEGATLVPHFVEAAEPGATTADPWRVTWREGGSVRNLDAHLVVVAVGARSSLASALARQATGYRPPETTGSIQAEVRLGREGVDRTMGNRVGAYLLHLEGLQFAALTPKGQHVTVTLIGNGANKDRLAEFLAHPVVRRRLGGEVSRAQIECMCRPEAVTGAARHPYSDRMVVVGDAAACRLYKNGLQSSLVTARAAVRVAMGHGLDASAFARFYEPVCREIEVDNRWGHLLFEFSRLAVVRGGLLAGRLLAAVAFEQNRLAPGHRPVCELLWDTLSGTRPYAQIVRHGLRPGFYAHLARREAGVA